MKYQSSTGINITKDDPFHIKETLKKAFPYQREKLIDLSRGEPYNPPDINADSVYAGFLLWSLLVSKIIGDRPLTSASESAIYNAKTELRNSPYTPIDLLDYTIEKITEIHNKLSGSTLSKLDLIKMILSGVRGEDYADVLGENPIRSLVAHHLEGVIKLPNNKSFKPEEIILTIGGSEAIGAISEIFMSIDLFEKGCNEKAKYKVAMLSPLYSPYKFIFEKMGVGIYTINSPASNGYEPTEDELKKFDNNADSIKLLILVNPGNPTGRSLSDKVLKRLADICKKHGILVITDIVYAPFLKEPMDSIITYAPKNTILVGSGSKFYQETGTRFGFVLVTNETERFITTRIGDKLKRAYQTESLIKAIEKAKGPDPVGTFYHTHHVPTPIQWLGAFRLLLGEEDARKFTNELFERWEALYNGLNLQTPLDSFPYAKFVPYYALIDLKEVAEKNGFNNFLKKVNNGTLTPDFFIEELFSEAGILVLPAATFFPGQESQNKWKVRFSVANQPIDKIKQATKRVINLMRELN